MLRPLLAADLEPLWAIFSAIVAEGTMLAQDESTTRDEFERYWLDRGGEQWTHTDEHGHVLGGMTIRPNHPGRGAHIGTATYVVAKSARGRGVGFALGQHSLVRARAMGFRAMQFNLVVSTNESAVRLWRRLGFAIVATLPRVFRDPSGERVDAFVMFQSFED